MVTDRWVQLARSDLWIDSRNPFPTWQTLDHNFLFRWSRRASQYPDELSESSGCRARPTCGLGVTAQWDHRTHALRGWNIHPVSRQQYRQKVCKPRQLRCAFQSQTESSLRRKLEKSRCKIQ